MNTGTLLAVGLGYSATWLANRLHPDGWRIIGTATSDASAAAKRANADEIIVFDGAGPAADLDRALSAATHLLVSVPPDRDGDPLLRCHGERIAAQSSLRWIGYLSTVGVYGDHAGGWVDEETPPAPVSERGRRRLAAELAWRALADPGRRQVQVFRLPGIYGPGRSAIESVRAGTARRLDKPGQVFNRIHVADIANALAAAVSGRGRFDVYNLTDDEPAAPELVVAHAARLLGAPVPPLEPFEATVLSPMAASFYGESKRVSNRRMKSDLGVTLIYPSFREGLAAIAAG
jgi:hypothetical protein